MDTTRAIPLMPACTPRLPDCHDPFWPRIGLSTLRQRLALDGRISDARLALAMRCAGIAAAQEFASWRAALRIRGYKRLEDIGGHRHGRALSRCYERFVETAVIRALATTGACVLGAKEERHD